jgi:hypothetical protein
VIDALVAIAARLLCYQRLEFLQGVFGPVHDSARRQAFRLFRGQGRDSSEPSAPDISSMILEGRQPASMTLARLKRACPLPLSWEEQPRALLWHHRELLCSEAWPVI